MNQETIYQERAEALLEQYQDGAAEMLGILQQLARSPETPEPVRISAATAYLSGALQAYKVVHADRERAELNERLGLLEEALR